MQLLVVPRSMPMVFAMVSCLLPMVLRKSKPLYSRSRGHLKPLRRRG
jgi:hypothetical protein